MAETTETPVASARTWGFTIGSGLLALLSHLAGGTSTEHLTGALAGVALVGAVYLLYRWGQQRDRSSEDGESRREKEMKAEAGGYGGNGGGL